MKGVDWNEHDERVLLGSKRISSGKVEVFWAENVGDLSKVWICVKVAGGNEWDPTDKRLHVIEGKNIYVKSGKSYLRTGPKDGPLAELHKDFRTDPEVEGAIIQGLNMVVKMRLVRTDFEPSGKVTFRWHD